VRLGSLTFLSSSLNVLIMISTTLVALSAVVLSASARQIQSRSPNCMAFLGVAYGILKLINTRSL
jgi:hypothetical protein